MILISQIAAGVFIGMALKAAVAVLATYAEHRYRGMRALGNFDTNDSQARILLDRFLAALHS